MVKWKKKGFIYKPDGSIPWSVSHAQVPVADYIEDENVIKVYFSTRDKQGRSLPACISLDADDPKKILEISQDPIMSLGDLGMFDDCGVMPSWIINKGNNEKWLYYIGWNVRNTIAYHNSVGLAISKDGGITYNRFSKGPLWDRNYIEPHYSGTSCVIFDKGIWKNWYLSCTEWCIVDGKTEPRYHIKYAESVNGIDWERKGVVAIDYHNSKEAGIVKASVVIVNGEYKMWYSYRNFDNYRINKSNSYRIGYASSVDGINWKRQDDKSGIERSEKGWDSLMIEYPHVIKVKNQYLMFYNGNGFGESGFGFAVSNIL